MSESNERVFSGSDVLSGFAFRSRPRLSVVVAVFLGVPYRVPGPISSCRSVSLLHLCPLRRLRRIGFTSGTNT